jgi:hypothetical protein
MKDSPIVLLAISAADFLDVLAAFGPAPGWLEFVVAVSGVLSAVLLPRNFASVSSVAFPIAYPIDGGIERASSVVLLRNVNQGDKAS